MQANLVEYRRLSKDYQLVEQAIMFLEEHYREQPSLRDVAESVGFSEYHFQRLFTRWVGISPKRFIQFLTKEHARQLLEKSTNLLEVANQTGLSGPGRLHDLFVACEAVTPGEYKSRGEGLTIYYGFHPSTFGECLLAVTDRGICGLIFVQDGDRRQALQNLKSRWRSAALHEDLLLTESFVGRIFPLFGASVSGPLSLFLSGTNFQIKVWEALLRIPMGSVIAYQDIAINIGMPGAARAVSRAVASNPIPVIIPCHRVIRKMGAFGGYRWGTARKKAILGWEFAQGEI